MKKIRWKTILKWTTATLALLAAIVIVAVVLLPTAFGYPRWFREAIANGFVQQNGTCTISAIRGNIFTGLELAEIQIEVDTDLGTVRFNTPCAELHLRPASLLRGKFVMRELRVTRGEACLNVTPQDNEESPVKISLQKIQGKLQTTLKNKTIVDIDGILQGVPVSVVATLDDKEPPRQDRDATPPDTKAIEPNETEAREYADGQGQMPETRPTPATIPRNLIGDILDEIDVVTGSAGEAYIKVNVAGNASFPESLEITGEGGIVDAVIKGRAVSSARIRFSFSHNLLKINKLHILYNPNEMVDIEGRLDFDAGMVAARATGELMPQTLLRLLMLPQETLPQFLKFTSPLAFQGVLPECPLDPAAISPTMDFSCPGITVEQLKLRNARGRFALKNGLLHLEGVSVGLGENSGHSISGEMTLSLADSMVKGNLSGTVDLGSALRGLGVISSRNTPFDAFTNAEFKASLAPSPIKEWRKWHAALLVSQKQSALAKLPLQNLAMKLTLSDLKLNLDAEAAISDEEPNLLKIHAETSFPESNGNLTIAVRPCVRIGSRTALEANAEIILDPDFETIAINNGKCSFLPELVFRVLERPCQLGKDFPLTWFVSDKPSMLTFQMPEYRWHAPKDSWDWDTNDWTITGHFDTGETRLLKTDFSSVSANVVIDKRHVEFNSLNGILANKKGTLSGNLKIQYSPLRLNFEKIAIHGPPLAFAELIYSDEAIAVYRDIWEEFQPAEGFSSEIIADSLEYKDLPDGEWTFTMEGRFSQKDFAYSGLPMERISADIRLELPNEDRLLLTNIKVTEADGEEESLTGRLTMGFKNGIAGVFHCEKGEGNIHILELLKRIFPGIKGHLDEFDLPPDARFTCEGAFHSGTTLSLAMQGTIESKSIKYRKLEIQNINGNWKSSNARFSWDIPQAELFGGKIATTGSYNINLNQSEFLAVAKEIPLAHLLQLAKGKLVDETPDVKKYETEDLPGKTDVDGHFFLLHGWAGKPLHVEGSGKLNLYDMDLWRVPTLTTLGKIIAGGTFNFFSKDKIASLGKISTLDTNFECHGNSIVFRDIRTDGSFIALNGNGEYRLDTNQMYFEVSGKLLKSVSIISWLLRPISWAFNAELTGTPQDHEWRLRSALRKLFK